MMTAQSKPWYLMVISMLLLIGLYANEAYSQSGPNYIIKWAVVDAGGLQRSATYRVSDSLDYVAGTNITSTSLQYINRPHAKVRLVAPESLPAFAIPTEVATVPEASTLVLFGVGLLGLGVCIRTLLKKR